ncbi:hypothetical protein [Nocardia puris]|uniref:hypothetical protein n=1 Tax=Nocardia puris TaxID=208602 RepID=UPI000DE93087|nr:hypothetical protein [Nocardia puris]
MVAPHENAAAQALLSAASRPGNELTAFELMAAHTRHHLEDTDNDAALRRWDDEGGRSAHPRRVNTTVPEA